MSFPSAIAVLLALVFIWAGFLNIAGPEFVRTEFERLGYSSTTRIAVGAAEWVAAGLFLWPRMARWGAAVAIVVLVGVLFSLSRSRAWMRLEYPAVLMALSMLILTHS